MTWPLTGNRCVSRLITDQGVFDFTHDGVILKEVSNESSVEKIRSMTDIKFTVADDIKIMEDNSSKYHFGESSEEVNIFEFKERVVV